MSNVSAITYTSAQLIDIRSWSNNPFGFTYALQRYTICALELIEDVTTTGANAFYELREEAREEIRWM